MQYKVRSEVLIPEEFWTIISDNLTFYDVCKKNYQFTGGDRGDLRFQGYIFKEDRIILYKPVLVTCLEDLTEEDVLEIAREIVNISWKSSSNENTL
jgi:hypothetical protein